MRKLTSTSKDSWTLWIEPSLGLFVLCLSSLLLVSASLDYSSLFRWSHTALTLKFAFIPRCTRTLSVQRTQRHLVVGVVFGSRRLLHSLLLLHHHLSYHFAVLLARQLQLPRCGGQIPCVLPLRSLAPWPRTSLPKWLPWLKHCFSLVLINLWPGMNSRVFFCDSLRAAGNCLGTMLNRDFLRVDWRNYLFLKIFVFPHGLMTWLVMQRNVWNDIVSWRTRRLSNSTKYLLHASMTTTSKREKQNLLENCQIHVLKLFWNVYIWQELDDLIFYGQ